MKRNKISFDLLVIFIWIMATIIVVTTPLLNASFIKTIIGIPMVLFIPGYLLVSFLFIGIDDIKTIRRIALSFCLSIAIISLLGLLLNFTFGLELLPVLNILCIYDIVFIFATSYRRAKLPENKRFSINFDGLYQIIVTGLKPKGIIDAMLTVVVILTTILAIWTTHYVITTPRIGERFTEFYVLDNHEKMDNYPTDISVGSLSDMIIYISNQEHDSTNYTLQVDIDKNILIHKRLILKNNETWKQNITFSPDIAGNNKLLEFLLFKEDDFTTPYRELYMKLNVSS